MHLIDGYACQIIRTFCLVLSTRADKLKSLKRSFIDIQPVTTSFILLWWILGRRGGVVVRALVSHQCGPGSIPRLGVICGLS